MYKIVKPTKTTVEIQFSADKPEWEEAVQAAYEKTKGEYNIQGFRRGQAPRRLIERTYGESVFFEDAFAHLAEKAYEAALTANPEINPVGDPEIKLEKFVEGKMDGVIKLTVIPEVKLGKYKGLDVVADLLEFTDDMLNAELEHAREHMTVANVVDGKVSASGDVVVLDFLGTLDGVPFDGGKAEDYELKLGSHSFIDNFEDQLIGHKAGDHVTVSVTFPENYGAKELAGKKAVFECDIKAVKVPEVPALDDDFAKSMGDYETLDDYKKDVEAQIRHEIEHRNQTIAEDAILDAVVDASEIELPSIVIDQQLDAVMKDLNFRLNYQGMSLESYANYLGKTIDELREQHRKDAERIAKTKQVLEALVRAEGLRVSDDEMNAKLEEFAKIANKSLEDYKKSVEPRRLDHIYSDILMSKLMQVLTENNKVQPKTGKQSKPTAKKASTKSPAKSTKTATTSKTAKKEDAKPAEKKVTKSVETKSAKKSDKTTTKTTKDDKKTTKSTKSTKK